MRLSQLITSLLIASLWSLLHIPLTLAEENNSSCTTASLENMDVVISCLQLSTGAVSTRLEYRSETANWRWVGTFQSATCQTSSACVTLTKNLELNFPEIDLAGSKYNVVLAFTPPTSSAQKDYYWHYSSHTAINQYEPITNLASSQFKVLAFNDLGMHCIDREFSIFSVLPPFNVVNAQVVRSDSKTDKPELLNAKQVELRYAATADRNGSINSTSRDKTTFWQYAEALFGKALNPNESLTGLYMPADNPQNPGEQAMSYNSESGWFSAAGIPITPKDDADQVNFYPMLRISAHEKQTGKLLAQTDIVVPVSMETDCQGCHATGKVATNSNEVTWVTDSDVEIQAKKNILLLHDYKHFTKLSSTTPVLCAKCHYSPALDLNHQGPQGQQQRLATMSQAMHQHHGNLLDAEGNSLFPTDAPVEKNCYQCHPGKNTQCQRDAMKTGGITCIDCHGDMLAVGGRYSLKEGGSLTGANDGSKRYPWQDLPRCQSCHTGDAVKHLTGDDLIVHEKGIRLQQAYRKGDRSASPILAENQRFAENAKTLFRNSKGHGGIACEGCHGSTHATWPNPNAKANDNLTAEQLQGHSGTIIECSACHASGSLLLTVEGPHGLHNVSDERWTDGRHGHYYERDEALCQACHGVNLEGTPLAKMSKTRTVSIGSRKVTLQQGENVSCNLCHKKP